MAESDERSEGAMAEFLLDSLEGHPLNEDTQQAWMLAMEMQVAAERAKREKAERRLSEMRQLVWALGFSAIMILVQCYRLS